MTTIIAKYATGEDKNKSFIATRPPPPPTLGLTTNKPHALLENKTSDAAGRPSHGCESIPHTVHRCPRARSEHSGWSPGEATPLRWTNRAQGDVLAEDLARQTVRVDSDMVEKVDSLLVLSDDVVGSGDWPG